MEQVLFYGVPHGCSFGSIVALEWINQPYRLCRIDMLDPGKDAIYSRVNPLRETPALLTPENALLSESLAILQHVAAQDLGRGLGFRQGTRDFDRLNGVLAFLVTAFHGAWGAIFQPAKYADGEAAQASVRSKAIARAARGYAHVEALLGDRPYLLGDTPTIADAYLYGVARWGDDLGVIDIRRDYPRVYAFQQRMAADPAVKFAHAIEDETPAASSGRFLGPVSLEEIAARLDAAAETQAVAA